MDLGIGGRVAIVTASSRGLGRASAEALAAEGAKVVLSARGREDLRQAENMLL
ncbi:MAG: SDR family NAD(P)-dependent oxidoreductase, partial [Acidimicrobiales bacterium]